LHAVTLGAAYLLGQDDKKGSIKAGKLADFTVLDRDPLDVASPDELRDITVLGTVLGGKAFPAGAIGEKRVGRCPRPAAFGRKTGLGGSFSSP